MKRFSAILLLINALTFQNVCSQVVFGIKFIGITAHVKKSPHPHLYKYKLDKNGVFVPNSGVMFSVEFNVYRDKLAIEITQGVFYDCAVQPAGFTHLGFRANVQHNENVFCFGNGPTLFYRHDWKNLPGYVDEGLFKRFSKWQYRFFWYAGEIEYNVKMSDQNFMSLSLIPGYPEFFTLTAGYRQTIVRRINPPNN